MMAMRPVCGTSVLSLPSLFNPATRTACRAFSTIPSLQAPNSARNKDKEKAAAAKLKKKRKRHASYKQYDMKEMQQFALCDAMQYIRAFEVGKPPNVAKYDCAVKLRTKKDGPIIRNQIRLPHSVKTDIRIAVICPPDSPAAKQARDAGAVLVGEEELFEVVKSGKIDFDRCIAHSASLPKLAKAGMPRILGPRGLMPSVKLGTVVDNVGSAVKNMLGASMYRERQGVIRMAIGRLGFTPEMLRDNLKTMIAQIKKDAGILSEQVTKEVHEVVLSSTNSPGFSLNGHFRSDSDVAAVSKSTIAVSQ